MLGAIFGDIVGSVYEFNNTHDYNFRRLSKWSQPTDDSYMTLAVAKSLMETYGQDDDAIRAALVKNMQDIGRRYPHAGYGGMFRQWLRERHPAPYNSFGNGSAMRVAASGWLYQTLDETLHAAEITADVTHNHPEGIKGAQAVAAAIFLARAGATKEEITNYIANTFSYNLFRSLDQIRPEYGFYEICQKSCPEAIIAFIEGNDFEDVIRKAVSLGGDSDTIACMAGAIAEAYYGMPEEFKEETLARLDPSMRAIAHDFRRFYHKHSGKTLDGWKQDIEPEITEPFMQFGPLIEERIEAHWQNPGNEKAIGAVLDSILTAMCCDGHVLVPVETPEAAVRAFDPSKINIGDEVTIQEDLHFTLIHLEYDDGTIGMPVFTSRKTMEEAGADCSIISMNLDAYMSQVLEMDNVNGLIINPGKNGFFVVRDLIEILLNECKANKTIQHTTSRDATLVPPRNVPEGFEELISEFIRNNLSEQVDRVWFTGLTDNGEDSWLFAIESEQEDLQEVFGRMQTMMNMLNVKMPVDYMKTAGSPWPGARLIYDNEESR